MADLLVGNVRVGASATTTAIAIRDGRIDTVGPAPADWQGPVVDGAGHLALPGLVDGHAHVDKTLWGLPWRPHSAGRGLAARRERALHSRDAATG